MSQLEASRLGAHRPGEGQLGFLVTADDFGDRTAPPLLLIIGLGLQMIAWDDPNFDFNSGRAWLFEGLKTLGAA